MSSYNSKLTILAHSLNVVSKHVELIPRMH